MRSARTGVPLPVGHRPASRLARAFFDLKNFDFGFRNSLPWSLWLRNNPYVWQRVLYCIVGIVVSGVSLSVSGVSLNVNGVSLSVSGVSLSVSGVSLSVSRVSLNLSVSMSSIISISQ